MRRTSRALPGVQVFFFVLTFAILVVSSARAAPPAGSLTAHTLRSLKQAALEDRKAEFKRDLSQLVSATPTDEAAIVAFIKSDLVDAEGTYSAEAFDRLDELIDQILKVLERIGTARSVPVLIDWLATWKWTSKDVYPLAPARTVLVIAERVPVTKAQLRPLLDSTNPNMAKMAAEMWNIISFENVPQDTERVVASGASLEEMLVREAGAMDNWEDLAIARGYDLSEKNRTASLATLILDIEKGLAEMEGKYRRGEYKDVDFNHLRSRELLLRLRALKGLLDRDRNAAFDVLVDWLEIANDWSGSIAAYFLYELTGQSQPIHAYFDYGKLRGSILVNRKAAAAWRNWRKQQGDLPQPDKSEVNTQKRLVAFQLDRHRKAGVEFTRPVDEVISELLASNDRRILDMMVRVLATKTLTEAQVKRIIDASQTDTSEIHRKYLLQVLGASGAASAAAHVASIVNASSPENTVLEYVSSLTSVGPTELDLLENLYAGHKSDRIRDAIVQRILSGDYSQRPAEGVQDRFVSFLLTKSKSSEHRLCGLRVVSSRPGVNRSGRQLVLRALESETSPATRQSIFEILLKHDADDALPLLLSPTEPEETKLIGLMAYRRILESDTPTLAFLDDELRVLCRAMKDDPSIKVRAAATKTIDMIRGMEIEEKLSRLRRGSVSAGIGKHLRQNKLPAAEKSVLKQQLQTMRKEFAAVVTDEYMIDELKQKYGDLPEEEQIRAELDKLRKKQLAELDETINLLK